MSSSLQIPSIFQQIFTTDKTNIAIPSGRISGKTKNSIIFCILSMLEHPYTDIVITRSSYGSMMDSSYAEFVAEMEELPEYIKEQFTFKKSPLRIERIGNSGTIYFIGSGGSNTDRTKGLKTTHPVKVVIVEETQEFKTKENYDQFMASVRRNYHKDSPKLIVLGNPPNNELHWFNTFIKRCEKDKDWLVLRPCWKDIVEFLNDYDIKEILKTEMLEPDYAQWLYYGIPTGGMGRVYPMFRKDIHLINYDLRSSSALLQDFQIRAVIIGCDGAVKGSTAFVPIFTMNNGQGVAGKVFYHNPQTNGVKGSFPLVENEGTRWFKDLISENNLDNHYDFRASIPIVFVVDSAAVELIQALKYYFGNRADVLAIKKSTIINMVDVVQSAIGKNVVAVYDYGGYYNYTLNKWIVDENPLAYQIRALLWNERQTGYDATIPNDICDAFTYGVFFYYRQTENLTWGDVLKYRQNYYALKKVE